MRLQIRIKMAVVSQCPFASYLHSSRALQRPFTTVRTIFLTETVILVERRTAYMQDASSYHGQMWLPVALKKELDTGMPMARSQGGDWQATRDVGICAGT